jgi:hypothetical protein
VAESVAATVATPSPVAQAVPANASLVVVSITTADVWLDGEFVGKTRSGPPTAWVATRRAPLSVTPGHHTVVLKNAHAEDWVQEFDATAGQEVVFTANLERKPVTVVVHPGIPNDCTFTVGGMRYGTVGVQREFHLPPDPTTGPIVVFTCGGKTVQATLSKTEGGETLIVPEAVSL